MDKMVDLSIVFCMFYQAGFPPCPASTFSHLDAGVLCMATMELLAHLPAGHDDLVPFPRWAKRPWGVKTQLVGGFTLW
jgi:hypothetical protein